MPAIFRASFGLTSGILGKTTPVLLLAAALLLYGCGEGMQVKVMFGDGTRANMFKGNTAQKAMSDLCEKIRHPAKALDVHITPVSLSLHVQDPAKPSHIDEYKVAHGYALRNRIHLIAITGPAPYQPGLLNGNLDQNLFDLGNLNLAGIAETAKSAVDLAGLEEGGAVAAIDIRRHVCSPLGGRPHVSAMGKTSCGEIRWDIQVKSDREYASAYADANGRIDYLNLDGTNRAQNLNLHADVKELQDVVGKMREVFGNTPGILKLTLGLKSIDIDARDPLKPKRLMNYSADLNGVWMGFEASSIGRPSNEQFFALDDVDWALVPSMLNQASAKVRMPKDAIWLVTLNKPDAMSPAFMREPNPQYHTLELRWTVDLRDKDGERAQVQFDPGGALIKVKLPE
ncbi:MAG TPA: hypothetical protein VEF34_07025 [Syntrophobacteraceae bacterium]|nr:hypothetical protein [Syntrophobacteraceae bacterium]